MAAISSLLNPDVMDVDEAPLPSPTPSGQPIPGLSDTEAKAAPAPKKQKTPKDGPVFIECAPNGPVRYGPWETYDNTTLQELRKHSMEPLGEISRFHRHIPYSSKKSNFKERTGRDSLEVYQYTFKIPGHKEEYLVMWDYNIGLVRTTPFFRSLEYAKTVPSKAIKSNSGLDPIGCSLTGGSIAAQGFWLPFEAAKALAATFCYSIRYLLVPLFGPDFVHLCTAPSDEKFASMKIDPKITRSCGLQAEEYRREELRLAATRPAAPKPQPKSVTPKSLPKSAVSKSQTPESRPTTAGTYQTARGRGAGQWRPVNFNPDGGAGQGGMSGKQGLPSPSSTAVNDAARTTPREQPLLPSPSSMLTSAALFAHNQNMFCSGGEVSREITSATSNTNPNTSQLSRFIEMENSREPVNSRFIPYTGGSNTKSAKGDGHGGKVSDHSPSGIQKRPRRASARLQAARVSAQRLNNLEHLPLDGSDKKMLEAAKTLIQVYHSATRALQEKAARAQQQEAEARALEEEHEHDTSMSWQHE